MIRITDANMVDVGYVDEGGDVYNNRGTVIGGFRMDGTIYSIAKDYVGEVTDSGDVYAGVGEYAGTVTQEGDMYGSSTQYCGTITSRYDHRLTNLVCGAALLLLLDWNGRYP